MIVSSCQVTSDENKVGFALKALTLTDLTTLAGDDCTSNVDRLCVRACYPFYKHSITNDSNEFLKKLHVAAVCVYPTKVKDAYDTLKRLNMLDKIQIASGNDLSMLWIIICKEIRTRSDLLVVMIISKSYRVFILSKKWIWKISFANGRYKFEKKIDNFFNVFVKILKFAEIQMSKIR